MGKDDQQYKILRDDGNGFLEILVNLRWVLEVPRQQFRQSIIATRISDWMSGNPYVEVEMIQELRK